MARIDPETGEIRPGCLGVKADGTACQRPVTHDGWCPMHDPSPEGIAWRAAGQLAGGRKPVLKKLPGMVGEVQEPADVLRICNTLLATLLERDANPASVAAISRVLALCLDTMTGIQMEARVAALEDKADAIEG